jgi:hypothetical protein
MSEEECCGENEMPLGKSDVTFLIDRNDKMKTTRALYEPLWEDIARFISPNRMGIGYKPSPGAKQTTDIYDSGAIFASDQFASSMSGAITPSSSKWHYLKLADYRMNSIKEIMDWLELCTELMHYTRMRSNFYSEIPEVYSDLGNFGEGCLFIEENPIKKMGFNGIYYKALANSEYCTAENHQGFVDTLFREFEMSVIAASKKWEDKLPKKITDELTKEPDKKFKFLHCVFPDDKPSAKEYLSYYISLDEKELISEGGYYEFPYAVPRMKKSSGEEYGRGQGHIALPDTKSLNKAKEFGLKAWAKELDPATFEKDGGVIGSLKLRPGGRNIVRDKDSIWMLDHHIRYDVSQIKEDELRKSIRQIYYSDQLQIQEGPEMTATEIQVRYELMQRLLGPGMGRITIELLKPCIEREFGIQMRARALPMPPKILSQMGVREIDVEYEGPLARAQRASDILGVQRTYSFVTSIMQTPPTDGISNPRDILDDDEATRFMAEASGAPSRIIKSVEQVQALRQNRMKQMQAEMQKQDMERLAEGASKAIPAVKAIGEVNEGMKEQGATA